MNSYKSFETERLILRPSSEEDAMLIYEIVNTPKWLRFIGDRNVKSEEDAKRYVRDYIRTQYIRLGYSSYTIIRKMDDVKVGICGLHDREGLDGIDLGFALLPQYEGYGYALEATREVQRAAVDDFGLSQLKAITAQGNVASISLLKKLDFRLIGPTRLPMDDKDLYLYEWNEEEWK